MTLRNANKRAKRRKQRRPMLFAGRAIQIWQTYPTAVDLTEETVNTTNPNDNGDFPEE